MTTIDLPAETAPARRPRAEDATVDAVEQTIAAYEAAAIGTGEWNGTPAPEFSHDGVEWTTAWGPAWDNVPAEEDEPWTAAHPTFARATVYRKGVKKPTTVVIRWDEAIPATDPWRTLWFHKPTALFGAFTLRAAYRRAFRDVIGDTRAPDENPEVTP